MTNQKKHKEYIELGLKDAFYGLIIVMIAVSSLIHIARTNTNCNRTYDPYNNRTPPNLSFNFCCYEPDCEESNNNPETCVCIYTKDCTPITWEEFDD